MADKVEVKVIKFLPPEILAAYRERVKREESLEALVNLRRECVALAGQLAEVLTEYELASGEIIVEERIPASECKKIGMTQKGINAAVRRYLATFGPQPEELQR